MLLWSVLKFSLDCCHAKGATMPGVCYEFWELLPGDLWAKVLWRDSSEHDAGSGFGCSDNWMDSEHYIFLIDGDSSLSSWSYWSSCWCFIISHVQRWAGGLSMIWLSWMGISLSQGWSHDQSCKRINCFTNQALMSEREGKTLDTFILWLEGNLNGLGIPLSQVCGAISAPCNQILQEFSMKNLHFPGGSSLLELFNKSFKTEVLGLKWKFDYQHWWRIISVLHRLLPHVEYQELNFRKTHQVFCFHVVNVWKQTSMLKTVLTSKSDVDIVQYPLSKWDRG